MLSSVSTQYIHRSLSEVSSGVGCRINICACFSQQPGESQWTSDGLLLSLRGKGFASSFANYVLQVCPMQVLIYPKHSVILTPSWKLVKNLHLSFCMF